MGFIEDNLNTIILGDCLDVMKLITDKSIDLVLTDPPYNASNSNIGFSGKKYKSINSEWDKGFNPIDFLELSKDKLKDNGSMLVFCSYHLLGTYLNWKGMKLQQIIHWRHLTAFPAIAKIYTPAIEYIVWYSKPNYVFNKKLSGNNVIDNHKSYIVDGDINHPSPKPTNLIEKLLSIHSNKDDLILDCFSGSGTTAIACSKLKRNFICIEKDPDYHSASVKRLEDFKKQLTLF